MVETHLVNDDWNEVLVLSELLDQFVPKPLVQAVFVAPWAEWRLVSVMRDLDRMGTRPVYAHLDESVRSGDIDPSLPSRVMLLDVDDPQARQIIEAPAEPIPPRRFEIEVQALPELVGAVIKHDTRALHMLNQRRLETEVLDELQHSGARVEIGVRDSSGWQRDVVVIWAGGSSASIEIVTTTKKSWRSRLIQAAGLANLTKSPVVLVVGAVDLDPDAVQAQAGVVPVFPVIWNSDDPTEFHTALVRAEQWVLP